MNERIRELWTQAGGRYDSGNQHTWPQYTIDDPAKFAESIVREYIGILEEEIKLVEGYKSTEVKVDIIKCHQSKIYHLNKVIVKSKKHFGVAEREQ
jgi:hypothetical protein